MTPSTTIDVIFVGQQLPVMDGVTDAYEISRIERLELLIGHVPINGTTANARAEQVQTVPVNALPIMLTI